MWLWSVWRRIIWNWFELIINRCLVLLYSFWLLHQSIKSLLSEVLPSGIKMAKSDGGLDRIRKQLRSVLISEKHGVAVERVERDYLELV